MFVRSQFILKLLFFKVFHVVSAVWNSKLGEYSITDWTTRLIIYTTDFPIGLKPLGTEDGNKHHGLFYHVYVRLRLWRFNCREQGKEEERILKDRNNTQEMKAVKTTLSWDGWQGFGCQKQSDQENSFWGNSQASLRMSRLVCLDMISLTSESNTDSWEKTSQKCSRGKS